MLAAKKYFENNEQFELCQIITEEMANFYSWEKNSPTDIEQLTEEDYLHLFWRLGMPGAFAMANFDRYTNSIIEQLTTNNLSK